MTDLFAKGLEGFVDVIVADLLSIERRDHFSHPVLTLPSKYN
ncbi:MAG TPA: hypothetical protein VE223_08480 [Nitrososphaeraceae archaeon]|jgi:hypothetical protein|nr:hypothetical protein [Nitrososphaeraceae archaeon]